MPTTISLNRIKWLHKYVEEPGISMEGRAPKIISYDVTDEKEFLNSCFENVRNSKYNK